MKVKIIHSDEYYTLDEKESIILNKDITLWLSKLNINQDDLIKFYTVDYIDIPNKTFSFRYSDCLKYIKEYEKERP